MSPFYKTKKLEIVCQKQKLHRFCISSLEMAAIAFKFGGSLEWRESLNLPDSRANAPRHHLVYQHKHHVSGGRRSPDDLASGHLIGRRRLNRAFWLVDGGCGTCDGGESGDHSWVSWGRRWGQWRVGVVVGGKQAVAGRKEHLALGRNHLSLSLTDPLGQTPHLGHPRPLSSLGKRGPT